MPTVHLLHANFSKNRMATRHVLSPRIVSTCLCLSTNTASKMFTVTGLAERSVNVMLVVRLYLILAEEWLGKRDTN